MSGWDSTRARAPHEGHRPRGRRGIAAHPVTRGVEQAASSVCDKPMVYYPLSRWCREDRRHPVITTTGGPPAFEASAPGLPARSAGSPAPASSRGRGLARAFDGARVRAVSASRSRSWRQYLLRAGFATSRRAAARESGATVFRYRDPGRYGVVSFDASGRTSTIEGKPKRTDPTSRSGLYFYDNRVVSTSRHR